MTQAPLRSELFRIFPNNRLLRAQFKAFSPTRAVEMLTSTSDRIFALLWLQVIDTVRRRDQTRVVAPIRVVKG